MNYELLKIKNELAKIKNVTDNAYAIIRQSDIDESFSWLEVITHQFTASVTYDCGFDLIVRYSNGEIDEYTLRTGCYLELDEVVNKISNCVEIFCVNSHILEKVAINSVPS